MEYYENSMSVTTAFAKAHSARLAKEVPASSTEINIVFFNHSKAFIIVCFKTCETLKVVRFCKCHC